MQLVFILENADTSSLNLKQFVYLVNWTVELIMRKNSFQKKLLLQKLLLDKINSKNTATQGSEITFCPGDFKDY